jgi:hypothetical protein
MSAKNPAQSARSQSENASMASN